MSFMHDTKQLSSKGSLYTHKLLGDTFAAQLEELRVGTAEVISFCTLFALFA